MEKYYILNSTILFKINSTNNRFYMYNAEKNEWVLNGSLMDRYYDASYDVIEISEEEAQKFIESLKGSVKKL